MSDSPGSSAHQDYQLAIIGAGTAGLAAVSEALEIGVERIALIEKWEVGGECAINACVPTKTMLTAAHYMDLLKNKMPQYGINAEFKDSRTNFDFDRLMRTVDEVIHDGGYDILEDPRITFIKGEAVFEGAQELSIKTNSETVRLSAEHLIIASGASPKIPNIEGLAEVGYLTYRQATHLKELPESLVIIGAGPVGTEFAYIFRMLGAEVSVLQIEDRLLPHAEPEISQAIQAFFKKIGIQVVLNCDIESFKCQPTPKEGQKSLKCLQAEVEGKTHRYEAEEILIATGMQPNFKTLQLEKADIAFDEKGIKLNDQMQSSNPNVWAVGDVAGPYLFTHVADYQAVLAVQNAFLNAGKKADYTGLGWAVFTEPTIASVGLNEEDARKRQDYDVESLIIKTSEVSRYRIEKEPDGFLKLIVDNRTQKILGGHIIASNADDIAHLLMLAVRNHMTVNQVLDIIYIYPSKAQLLQKALEQYTSCHRSDRLKSASHLQTISKINRPN